MSCNYADGLSDYDDKGVCGLPEVCEDVEKYDEKIKLLAAWIRNAKHVVVHTGAGISTAAGIPDFRGPNGVWTLQERGEKLESSISFSEAQPTVTHMALVALHKSGLVQHVISQNVDGLHLRSGLPRTSLSELHGNVYVEQCGLCERQFVSPRPSPTVGQKCLGKPCPTLKANGRRCRGKLHDNILDWEDNLPQRDLDCAHVHSKLADLSLALGTTLQINPSGCLPLAVKKKDNGKLVICNLQSTKYDKFADVKIAAYVDDVLVVLCKYLDVTIPAYCPDTDPVVSLMEKFLLQVPVPVVEWTLQQPDWKRIDEPRKRKIEEAECVTD